MLKALELLKKIVKQIGFKETWVELEIKTCFQGQSWTGYLAAGCGGALREGLNFCFLDSLARIEKKIILRVRLSANL